MQLLTRIVSGALYTETTFRRNIAVIRATNDDAKYHVLYRNKISEKLKSKVEFIEVTLLVINNYYQLKDLEWFNGLYYLSSNFPTKLMTSA